MIRKGFAAFVRFVWKGLAVLVVTLLALLVMGWFVDVVVDPSEEEITTVDR